MEQSGRNRWQPVANGTVPKTARTSQTVAMGCNQLPIGAHGKEGVDLSERRSKHLDTFSHRRFDCVITLCDRVREVCPEFPGQPEAIHWSIPDPSAEPGDDAKTLPAFERTAVEVETRTRFLLHRLSHAPIKEGRRP